MITALLIFGIAAVVGAALLVAGAIALRTAWDDFDRERLWTLGAILSAFGLVAVILGVGLGAVALGRNHACGIEADGLGLDHEWGMLTGCRVEVGGKLINLNRIRFTDTGVAIVGGGE